MSTESVALAIANRLALGTASAADLAQVLALSQSTLSRALRDLEINHQVLRMGSTRGARYALRRRVAAIGSQWPVYRVDSEGTPEELGELHALTQDGYYVTRGPERIQGLTFGLPYSLQDARPAGFLGRTVPMAYPELELPSRVTDWTEDHFLTYLTRRGADTSGNLIVGAEALDRYLAGTQAATVVSAQERHRSYPVFAAASMAGAPPGSSAHGEHPKFTVCIAEGAVRTHVIVKFSPPQSSPIGRRWADLLTAEYLAHRELEQHGIPACRSALFEFGDRVFLECERFDRVAAKGRLGAVSLLAVDSSRYGKLDGWSAAANRLAADAALSAEDAERIRFLDAFGALIANTDRHFGNVMLFDSYAGPFKLAPAYDMLPMLFAPLDGQIVPRQFGRPAPTSAWLTVWPRAHALAQEYWNRLINESRLSTEFRDLSVQCLAALRTSPGREASTRTP
jgi:DNA-binding transcriptional ArsR family regulator